MSDPKHRGEDTETSESTPLTAGDGGSAPPDVPSGSVPEGVDLPFRPFHLTPIHSDDDGPTDVSINHDRYFAEWTLETLHGPKRRDTGKPDPPS